MIHYHGGPITPDTVALRAWKGRHAFASFATIRNQIELVAGVCQSFALDNGAFSIWRKTGEPVADWSDYYCWAGTWLTHPACDFAIIPDVIGGTEDENDVLVADWPFAKHEGVPVWHLNESLERLVRLAREWPRVALGSADEWDVKSPRKALERLAQALPAISDDGRPRCKLHGLRMLNPEITGVVPLASADSTNTAFNHGKDGNWKGRYMPASREARAEVLVGRIEAVDTPGRWDPPVPQRLDLTA